MIDGKQAIVIGLMGLDQEHDGHSEIHPVFVLAIHVSDDPYDDTWAIFARTQGNEGWCSSEMHFANFTDDTVILQLPRPTSVAATIVPTVGTKTQFFGSTSNVTVDVSPGANQDTYITFHLRPPSRDDGIYADGELHMNWGTTAPAAQA